MLFIYIGEIILGRDEKIKQQKENILSRFNKTEDDLAFIYKKHIKYPLYKLFMEKKGFSQDLISFILQINNKKSDQYKKYNSAKRFVKNHIRDFEKKMFGTKRKFDPRGGDRRKIQDSSQSSSSSAPAVSSFPYKVNFNKGSLPSLLNPNLTVHHRVFNSIINYYKMKQSDFNNIVMLYDNKNSNNNDVEGSGCDDDDDEKEDDDVEEDEDHDDDNYEEEDEYVDEEEDQDGDKDEDDEKLQYQKNKRPNVEAAKNKKKRKVAISSSEKQTRKSQGRKK